MIGGVRGVKFHRNLKVPDTFRPSDTEAEYVATCPRLHSTALAWPTLPTRRRPAASARHRRGQEGVSSVDWYGVPVKQYLFNRPGCTNEALHRLEVAPNVQLLDGNFPFMAEGSSP